MPKRGGIVSGSQVVEYANSQTIEAVFNDSSIGADVAGLKIYERGTVRFFGEKTTISSVSASNAYPTSEGGDWPQITAGVSIFGVGTLTSAKDSSLVITARNTGKGYVPEIGDNLDQGIDKSNFAGFVVGLQAEGGKIDLQGSTSVVAEGDGAYTVGMSLQALAGDSEWVETNYDELGVEDFSLTADFGGDLTVTATSQQSGAEAIRLGGYVPGEADPNGSYAYPENVQVVVNTSATGTTTITATTVSDKHESVGVNFVYPDAEGSDPIDTPEEFTTGRGYLNLNGTTVITADHALKGDVGYVINRGDLTLNGRVDQFKGDFTQESGKTALNDTTGHFFGGSVEVKGGTLTAANATWDSTTGGKLKVSDAEISLHKLDVKSNGKLELSNSKVTANFFNVVNHETSIDVDGSSFVLNGNDDEDSAIHGTVTGIKDLIVNGGTLDLTENAELAFVEGGKLVFNDGALFSVRGKMGGADVIFNDGTYLYEPEPNVPNELRIESGKVDFNGQVGLLTGVTEDGSDMTFEQVDYMTALSIGPNDSQGEPDPNVTFNGGTYDFEKVQAHAGSLTFMGEDGKVSIDELEVNNGTVSANGGSLKVGTLSFAEGLQGRLEVKDGTLTVTDAQWIGNSTGKRISVSGGELQLDAMHISAADDLQFTGGKITVTGNEENAGDKAFVVAGGVELTASGNSVLELRNDHYDPQQGATFASIQGKLTGLGSLVADIGFEDDISVSGGTLGVVGDALISGGTLDVDRGGLVTVGGTLTFENEAMLSIGALNDQNQFTGTIDAEKIVFETGTYIFQFDEDPENYAFRIEDWNVEFNGDVGLLTGGSTTGESDFDDTSTIANITVDTGSNVVFNNGKYSWNTLRVNEGVVTFAGVDGDVKVDTLLISQGNVGIVDGTLTAGGLEFEEGTQGTLSISGGTLVTGSDQVFTNAAGALVLNPQELKNPDRLKFESGTLVLNDADYTQSYADQAGKLVGADSDFMIKFTGKLNESIEGEINIGDLEESENTVHGGVDAVVSSDTGSEAVIDKSIGVSSVVVEGAETVSLVADKTLTLVGSAEESKEVIAFASGVGGTVKVAGNLVLGTTGSTDEYGKLSSAVTVAEGGKLAVNGGVFALADTTVTNGTVAVNGGEAKFEKLSASGSSIEAAGGSTSVNELAVSGTTKVAVGEKSSFKVEKMILNGSDNNISITGSVDVGSLALEEQTDSGEGAVLSEQGGSIINIGTSGEDGTAGSLTLGGETLAGVTYFLDPAYKDGIEQRSSLKFEGTTIDGKIIAGQNSYVVLGSKDDSALLKLFAENGNLSWGGGTDQIGSAVFVAKPITVTANGGIHADSDLTASVSVADGSVYFASNSALVADVTGVEEGTFIITVEEGASVTVKENSKAVLVGDIKQSIGYQLINNAEANQVWGENLIAGNGMWDLTMNEEGKIEATLNDAALVYGNAMQGTALANAGMLSSGAEYDYVNALLTDASGNISALPSIAERFDAAMNPIGALTSFTTAYDRASDLRRIVRDESVKGQGNRLWAQVSGSVTKLDGISSGGRAINTETNAYGLTVGGEVEFADYVLGAAFAGGTGHTDNDAVAGKDDFNYYGLSVYGKTFVGGFTLYGDVSATWLKSDLTIGGVADVAADTTTAVYSVGVQGEKTFDLSWADLTPFIGIDVYHVRSDGFDNGHGARIDDSDATAVEIPLGARLSKNIETTGGFHMAPSFMFAVIPTIADTEIDSRVTFAGANSTYKFTFADDLKMRANIGLDAVKDNFTFGLQAGYEWGNEERSSMNMQLRAKYAF